MSAVRALTDGLACPQERAYLPLLHDRSSCRSQRFVSLRRDRRNEHSCVRNQPCLPSRGVDKSIVGFSGYRVIINLNRLPLHLALGELKHLIVTTRGQSIVAPVQDMRMWRSFDIG